MFTVWGLTVNLHPFEPDYETAVLVAPAVDALVLHEPTVDDPVHDLVEPLLLVRLPKKEHIRAIIQGKGDVLKLVLPQVRGDGSPEWEPVRRTWPMQMTAVI